MNASERTQRLLSAVESALSECASGKNPANNKYMMAMIDRALGVVRRDLEFGVDVPERNLNRGIYEENSGSLEKLARNIRSRAISEGNRPDLYRLLWIYVEERLARWNPDHPAIISKK